MKTNSSQKIVIIVLAVLLVLALIFGGILLSRSNALRSQLSSMNETLDARNADLAAAADELESAKTALAELTEAQQTENEAKAEALRAKETELEAAKAELESTIAALEESEGVQSAKESELEAAKAELEAVKAELESVKAQLAELGVKQQEAVDALSAKEAELEAAVAALNEMTAKQQSTADALAEAETTLVETKTALAERESALAERESALAETESALAEATAAHHHVWGAWEVDIEPGCESEGREIRRCETEPSDEETRLIPALGHDWIPATFTQPKKCARCGEISGKSAPESSFPTMEDVRYMSQNSAITRVSNTDKTRLQLPAESSYLSEPYRAKLSNNIYIMPIPELGHGHLGIVDKGTDVAVIAKRNGYVFFVTYDGRMGWNGSQLVG